MDALSPFALAARQRDLDRAQTARFPVLFERKQARMLASPHALLRGSARLYYEILAMRPDLAAGPRDVGVLVGDMHLENVGAFPVDKDRIVFDLNDFDDATVGPLHLDVLRFSTSVLLAGRSFNATGTAVISLVEQAIEAYLQGRSGLAAGAMPGKISEMMARAATRTRHALLDGRAPKGRDGTRRFVRGERYLDLPREIEAQVPALLEAYVNALGDRAPAHTAAWVVEDAAQRVAGTGSLGVLRIALLVRAKDGEERIVEIKEQGASSTEALIPAPITPWTSSGDRVVSATRALLAEPPRQLAAVEGAGLSFAVRKLFPQEDKLAIDDLPSGAKLEAIVQTIAHLLGKAHSRALTRPAPWSAAEIATMIDHAVELAAMFEGVYLAYARTALKGTGS